VVRTAEFPEGKLFTIKSWFKINHLWFPDFVAKLNYSPIISSLSKRYPYIV